MLLEKEISGNVHVVVIHENIVGENGEISNAILHDYLHLTDLAYSKIFEPVYEKLCALINQQ